ncbi:hypothetical protein ACP70R_037582 [Stipagrostis hirtigluma subsp. patula]
MARKRRFKQLDRNCDSDSDDEYEDYHEFAQLSNSENDSDSDMDVEGNNSSDSEEVNDALYELYLKQRKMLKKLKSKMSVSKTRKAKKVSTDNCTKDAFTRFSVSYFSSVIESLSDERKKVIENYGFGSLLRFDKCFVPNKFAQWVVRQIDHRTGDIVVKNNIIPFTRESVHYVLGLPLGTKPFPKDSSVGKATLMSQFELNSIPSVKYFGNKLLKNEDLTDKEVFMCFILVALNCFLCPNASLPPASKYLGIFEDLDHIEELDWSQFVMDWTLDSVKSFNKGKNRNDQERPTLGGCLYLIAVYYLDFVDFGNRQVPAGLPRILYWKQNMITNFSMLDQISGGVYGFRPVMDISRTCYSKQSVFLHMNPAGLASNSEFLDALDSSSNCHLPRELKIAICDILEEHSLKSTLTFNMEITSLASLSDELKKTFSTLLEHAYSVDSRTQHMVLKLLKVISDAACAIDDEDQVKSSCPNSEHVSLSSLDKNQIPEKTVSESNTLKSPMLQQPVSPISQKGSIENRQLSAKIKKLVAKASEQNKSPASAKKIAAQIRQKLIQEDIEKVMDKITKRNNDSAGYKTPSQNPIPKDFVAKKHCHSASVSKRPMSKIDNILNYVTESQISKLRDDDYCDLSDDDYDEHVMRSKKSITFVRENGERDVIYLDNPKDYATESVPEDSEKGAMRYIFRKRPEVDMDDVDDDNSTPQTPMEMYSLPSSPLPIDRITPKLTQRTTNSASKIISNSGKLNISNNSKESPDCVITGEKDLFAKTTEMTKKADAMYNSKLIFGHHTSIKSENVAGSSKHNNVVHDLDGDDDNNDGSAVRPTKSTTGGKMPRYGPRRPIQPVQSRPAHVIEARDRFRVSESERKNYRAICRLASSKYKDDYAVDIGGVHCTFRSFGESLMPDGVVSNFLIAVFCRHLFMKNHPDVSKKHYFFSNISDQLLKHPQDAVKSVLERAFTRSRKARPLEDSNLLFFPVLFEHHWFVFVVDIKDHYFVFLDSLYSQDDPYHQHVRDRIIPSFILHWHKFVHTNREMNFGSYQVIYPVVPKQGEDNMVDCRIFIMMFLENWNSPRSVLTSIFDVNDIPKLRIKYANELMFLPTNNGYKRRVLEFGEEENDYSSLSVSIISNGGPSLCSMMSNCLSILLNSSTRDVCTQNSILLEFAANAAEFFFVIVCVNNLKLIILYVGPTLSLNLEFVLSLLAVLCRNGQNCSLKYTVNVSKSHLKVSIVSSTKNAQPKRQVCPWPVIPTKGANEMCYYCLETSYEGIIIEKMLGIFFRTEFLTNFWCILAVKRSIVSFRSCKFFFFKELIHIFLISFLPVN